MERPNPFFLFSIVLVVVGVATAWFFVFDDGSAEQEDMRILCAGSLLVSLNAVADAFEEANPDIDVEVEAHGSIQVVRHLTEPVMHDWADLAFVADYRLIEDLMLTTTLPDSDVPYAAWYATFATNEMVLAFTDDSPYADEINATNWYDVLARDDVSFGMADPSLDACGYRTLMLIQLAESYYGDNRLFETLVSAHFSPTFYVERDGDAVSIAVPESIATIDGEVVVRRSSITLAPLIDINAVDYGFIYLNEAEQHGLRYVVLPDAIHLGNESLNDAYETVSVTFDFTRFGYMPMMRERTAAHIEYGITMPATARNPDAAARFAEFLFSDEGARIFAENYQPMYAAPEAYGAVPDVYAPLVGTPR